jgi:hypothetical protein
MKKLLIGLSVLASMASFAGDQDFNASKYVDAIMKKDSSIITTNIEPEVSTVTDVEYQAELIQITQKLDLMNKNDATFTSVEEFDALADRLFEIAMKCESVDLAGIATSLATFSGRIATSNLK